MSSQVVEMGVGNKGAVNRTLRVEPPTGLRQPNSILKLNLPSHSGMDAQAFASREYFPGPVNSRPRHTAAIAAGWSAALQPAKG